MLSFTFKFVALPRCIVTNLQILDSGYILSITPYSFITISC